MNAGYWVLVGLGAWLVIAVAGALLTGAVISHADEVEIGDAE